MKISKLSSDFTPRSRGLLFGIDTEGSSPSDLLVEIVDAATGEVVATQQLREVITAEVNIAPYVQSFAEYCPSSSDHTTFKEVPSASYAIRVGNVLSEPLRVSVNSAPVQSPSLVTKLPYSRYIAYEESDELLIVAEEEADIIANITADTGEMLVVEGTSATGIISLSLSTNDFDDDIHTLDVELFSNGDLIGRVCYTLRPSYKGGVRLAWVSGKGSIERYTFPMAVKREIKSEKEHIDTYQGRRVVRAVSESVVSLYSRYEPRLMIQALADIATSPKVWIEDVEGYRAVEVKSSVVECDLFGEPDKLALNIVTWRREESVL